VVAKNKLELTSHEGIPAQASSILRSTSSSKELRGFASLSRRPDLDEALRDSRTRRRDPFSKTAVAPNDSEDANEMRHRIKEIDGKVHPATMSHINARRARHRSFGPGSA